MEEGSGEWGTRGAVCSESSILTSRVAGREEGEEGEEEEERFFTRASSSTLGRGSSAATLCLKEHLVALSLEKKFVYQSIYVKATLRLKTLRKEQAVKFREIQNN